MAHRGEQRVLVIDNGAGNIKLGWAGEEKPRMVFPNCTAKPKGERQVYVGDALLEAKDIMALNMRRPFDRGYMVQWDLEKEIWARAFKSAALSKKGPGGGGGGGAWDPASASLLLTEPIFNFPAVQAATEEMVFEQFGFRSLYVAPSPWFSLNAACSGGPPPPNATARSAAAAGAGIVVDAGFSAANVVPFFNGQLLAGGVQRLNLGGKALTNLLKETVSYRSLNMAEEAYLMEGVKDALCWVSQDVKADLKLARARASPFRREYVLPDGVTNLRGYVRPTPEEEAKAAAEKAAAAAGAAGAPGGGGGGEQGQQQQGGGGGGEAGGGGAGGGAAPQRSSRGGASDQVLVLNNELFMVPEVLFRPSDIGLQQAGLPEAVASAIAACHPALSPLLWSNVVLTGGCCRLPGLAARFERELRALAPDDFEVGVVSPQEFEVGVVSPQDPDLFAWQGASRFGATPQFSSAATTRAQYMENGPGNTGRR
ncbi:MAG: Actin/actin-like protein [Monoraphidium minutum]|nr:MAG: Actin/actin-like protein [Monoraphidium minutum]